LSPRSAGTGWAAALAVRPRAAPVLALAIVVLTAWLVLGPAAAFARPRGCEQNYPIAGTAGFANAQAARRTNVNTFSAASFAERIGQRQGLAPRRPAWEQRSSGFFAAEVNDTFGAARVPTYCADTLASQTDVSYTDPAARFARKERVYEQPLDLYAANLAVGVGTRGVGAFYSASVTQSVLGYRAWAIPAQIINAYPLTFAPFVGNFQRGDGVASYAVDWIGGAYLDTRWVGAHVGYTGERGVFGTIDERTLGLFGTVSTAVAGGLDREEAITYLRAGVQDLSLRRFGADRVGRAVGMTSAFLRDLPTGVESEAGAAVSRLRTVHVEQRAILDAIEVAASVRRGPDAGLFDAHLGWHSAGFYAHRGEERADADARYAVRLGMVNLPPRYTLGVDGGRFLAARAQLQAEGVEVAVLFNDPEQLALYPFATNALSVRLGVLLDGGL